MTKTIYLGLGSNLGDRENYLRRAIAELEASGLRITRASPIYETEPIENTRQGWFLNQVVEAEGDLFPAQLLARTSRIERDLHRVRSAPKGPRTIDIDILFFGRAVVNAPKLVIPHPAIAERRFVLVPLADLAPELRHPVTGKTVREMLEAAPGGKVKAFSNQHSAIS